MARESKRIVVGITRDFISSEGKIDFVEKIWDELANHPRIKIEILEEPAPTNITLDHTQRFEVIIMKRSPLRAMALDPENCRLQLVARNGVGYDHLDVDACTRAGVMIAITPEAVRRPVASANITLILAVAHRIFERDRRTRNCAWKKVGKTEE